MSLTAKTRQIGNVSIVDLNGKITLGESAGVLRDELNSLLAMGRKSIIINMANVSYVDSAGLGELVGKYTTAANQGGSLKLLHLQGKMKDLLQITKLHTIFAIYEDENEAVASFGQAAAKA